MTLDIRWCQEHGSSVSAKFECTAWWVEKLMRDMDERYTEVHEAWQPCVIVDAALRVWETSDEV